MINFMGIGAQKAGTTWLYKVLSEHPEIQFPASKEVHFWDSKRSYGVHWYRSLFSADQTGIQGEITPAYAILEPSIIREIAKEFPDIRVIYILRNPIERAWSSARMALYRAEMEMCEASDKWFIDHFRSAGSIARGDYRTTIERWREYVQPDRLGIFFFDDLVNVPERFIEDVCRHIGVPSDPLVTTRSETLDRKIRPVPHASTNRIRPSLLPELRDIYYKKIEKLQMVIDRSLSNWYI